MLTALLGCAALKRLVYVSCNPGSLAANGGVLCGAPRAEGHAGSHQRGGERPAACWRAVCPSCFAVCALFAAAPPACCCVTALCCAVLLASAGRGNGGGAAGGAPAYVPFRPSQVLAFDMFPHTAHVETLMLFERE